MYLVFLKPDAYDMEDKLVGINEDKDTAIQKGILQSSGYPFGDGYEDVDCKEFYLEVWYPTDSRCYTRYHFKKVDGDWYELKKVGGED